MHPQLYAWPCTRNVNFNLMPYLLIKAIPPAGKGDFDQVRVLGAFSGEGGYAHRGW